MRTRVNYVRMEKIFTPVADDDAGVSRGDFNLKQTIKSGKLNHEIFHVATLFYQFLDLYGDKIARPHQVEADTAELFEEQAMPQEVGSLEEPWYLKFFEPSQEGSSESELRAAAAMALQIGKQQVTHNPRSP